MSEPAAAGVRINPYGRGEATVETGLPVLNGLLVRLAEVARFDLVLDIEPGDAEAEVDAAAAALGEALAAPLRAEGARGYGAGALTSAEALAYVVLETSDDPLVVTNVDLTGARIGGLSTDVARRFLDVLAERRRARPPRAAPQRDGQRARARGDLQGAGRRAGGGLRATGGAEVSEKQVVRTEAAPAPFQGAPYSQAVVAGGFVFVSGQLGLKPGDSAIGGGIEEQTEQIFANLKAILEAAGSGLDRIVKTTVFLQHLEDFQAMNAVYAKHAGEQPPARATVGVAQLPSGALVEIEAIAQL